MLLIWGSKCSESQWNEIWCKQHFDDGSIQYLIPHVEFTVCTLVEYLFTMVATWRYEFHTLSHNA